jgi:hypothetical protein
MSRKNGDTPRWFRELDAANLAGYTTLIYETWRGDRDDPATQVEEWLSLFNEEDMPDEYSTAQDQSNIPPYVAEKSRYSYRDEYEGLAKALVNQRVKVVKETDKDAIKHQNESENLMPDDKTNDNYYYRRRESAGLGSVYYEDFLAAVERVSANDDDEEAWDIIDKWRSRRWSQGERSL